MSAPAHPDIYLIRLGEVSLKKRNRDLFINDLVRSVKKRIGRLKGRVEKRHKKLLLHCSAPPEEVRAALSTVFGISGISPIRRTSHDLEAIKTTAWEMMKPYASSGKTFGIAARRALKNYPLNSMQLAGEVAGYMLDQGLNLPVNLDKPDLPMGIMVELTETWLHLETWPGLCGLPVRSQDKYGLLLSGGIDSPVAGFMMQKRGAWLQAIYFHTPPYTVEKAKEKVIDLAQVTARYQSKLYLKIVNFTEIMQTLRAECHEAYTVVLGRRFMMRAASILMKRSGGKALITGESLGQVASQTIENIDAINQAASLPVLRPLIGMDKMEIVRIAEQIKTFDISIRPYIDCCSLFSPKEPVTRAKSYIIEAEEAKLDIDGLLERALASVEEIAITPEF